MVFSKQFTNMKNNVFTIEKKVPLTYDVSEETLEITVVYEYSLLLISGSGLKIHVLWHPFTLEGDAPILNVGDKINVESIEVNSIWIRDVYSENFPKYLIKNLEANMYTLNDEINFECNSFFKINNNKWEVIDPIKEIEFEANISFGEAIGIRKI